jgi:enoyl-CoA hydratase/carnithine racemase
MSEQPLIYTVENQVARLTINREKQRNALTVEVVDLFLKYLERIETDDTVRAVLVTGAGTKAFCSGADLSGAAGDSGKNAYQRYADLLKKLAGCTKPTVARVNGHCLAGGMGFMLGCDIVIARQDAKFGTPEVNVGLFPMMIGALIFRNAPRKKAMQMVLLGEKLTAAEALNMGLITRSVPHNDLDDTVNTVLDTLCAKSPIGLKLGKQAFYKMGDMPFEEALDYLSGMLGRVISTEDAIEGITAFMEKRKPVFKGK